MFLFLLQALNVYADQLSKGLAPDPAKLEFYVKRSQGTFSLITAELVGTASLSPLFFAFGLITEEEALRDAAAAASTATDGRDLFEWLSGVAAEASLAADQHDALKREVRLMRSELEERYGLAAIDIGGEYSLAGEAQIQQLQSLTAFGEGLRVLLTPQDDGGDASNNNNNNNEDEDDDELQIVDALPEDFYGLTVRLYHPDAAPLVTVGYQDPDGTFNVRSEPMESYISDTGTLQVVAHSQPEKVASSLARLDLGRAQLLAKVSAFWRRRSRALADALQSVLGVKNVWFYPRSEDATQNFVLWVGAVLERREDVAAVINHRSFAFSILVHSDQSSPLLEFIESSSVLQVRTDCPPKHLLAFMVSEAGDVAHETATLVADTRAEEAAALEAVKFALGAKHVVRVCSSYDQQKVLEAAARLVQAAPSIRAAMDLTNVSLAIDDCYDVWDSGFISIPFDFTLADLQPKLKALLSAPDSKPSPPPPPPPPAAAAAETVSNGAVQASAVGIRCFQPTPAAASSLPKSRVNVNSGYSLSTNFGGRRAAGRSVVRQQQHCVVGRIRVSSSLRI